METVRSRKRAVGIRVSPVGSSPWSETQHSSAFSVALVNSDNATHRLRDMPPALSDRITKRNSDRLFVIN